LLPKAGKSMFLTFPFIELGQCLDHSTKNLLIYGHPFFMFLGQTSFLRKLDVNTEYDFENVVIETYQYKILKNDNGNYKEYLHSSHLGLTMQWMLRNSDSVVSNSFEIVRDDFIRTVTHFYDCMMTTKGNINSYENAYIIHKYLMKKHSIIQSRFIFFWENYGGNHWIISCLCNPWIFLLQAMKKEDKESINEDLENLDDEIIHGWLTLDPLHGFLNEHTMDNDNKKSRDIFVWLLNLAALYNDCEHENTLCTLDFSMNRYLRYNKKSKWLQEFHLNVEAWNAFEEAQKEIEEHPGLVSPSFHWVV